MSSLGFDLGFFADFYVIAGLTLSLLAFVSPCVSLFGSLFLRLKVGLDLMTSWSEWSLLTVFYRHVS